MSGKGHRTPRVEGSKGGRFEGKQLKTMASSTDASRGENGQPRDQASAKSKADADEDSEVKKVNSVFDGDAVKMMLDETVVSYLSGKLDDDVSSDSSSRVASSSSSPASSSTLSSTQQYWDIDHTWTNYKLFLSIICVILAAVSHFWPQPFPENYYLLVGCFVLYLICSALIQWILISKEQNVVLTTKPRQSDNTGLIAKSFVKPFSPEYRLELIAFRSNADGSLTLLRSAERIASITNWFSESGKFAHSLFIQHIDHILADLELDKQ